MGNQKLILLKQAVTLLENGISRSKLRAARRRFQSAYGAAARMAVVKKRQAIWDAGQLVIDAMSPEQRQARRVLKDLRDMSMHAAMVIYCAPDRSSLIKCAQDTYNGIPGLSSMDACNACPTLSSTNGTQSSTSIEACVCDKQYFNNNTEGGVDCVPCPVGTECLKKSVTLLTLPLHPGYYRASNRSIDIRFCPDAIYGCKGHATGCTSACQGGETVPGCHPTLDGAFCLLCANRTGHFFSRATSTEQAQCLPCESIGSWLASGMCIIVASLLVLAYGVWRVLRPTPAPAAFAAAAADVPAGAAAGVPAGAPSGAPAEAAPASLQAAPVLERALYKLRDLWMILRTRIKLLVAFFQVASQIPYIYQVNLPMSVRDMVNHLENLISFGLEWISDRLICMGLPHGFRTRLLFWMFSPVVLMSIILIYAFVRIHRSSHNVSKHSMVQAAMLQATPLILWISFLAYSAVATTAFGAFTCYDFLDGASWLRADVSVRCGSPEHQTIKMIAWLAIFIWPIGATFAAFYLSFLAHADQVFKDPKRSRPALRHAISFLYIEYKPEFWWWEPMPMILRLILVGFFVLFEPGSLTQLALGMLTTLFFLLVQMQASPYRHIFDSYLAVSCNCSLAVFFLCCIVFKIVNFTQLDKVQGVMTPDLKADYSTSVLPLTVGMFTCLLLSLGLAAIFVVWRIDEDFRQRQRVRHKAGGHEAVCPVIQRGDYHLFLSHNWTQGQDEMRVVRQRLHQILPNAQGELPFLSPLLAQLAT